MGGHFRVRNFGLGLAAIVTVLCATSLWGQEPRRAVRSSTGVIDDIKRPAIEIEFTKDIVYGHAGDQDLKLDLAAPKGLTQPAPAVVWIHGGAWRGGRKDDFGGVIRESAEHGYVSVSISYRLVPKHLFPAQVEDCKCAVRWLRENAQRLNIDPNRIGVVGASAGAHLAMMLGAMDTGDGLEGEGGSPNASSRVQAVVSFCGPTNLQSEFPDASKQLVADFIGGPAPEKAAAAKAASPITYVNKEDPPMLLIQGTKDPLVPHDQAVQMVEALTAAGVPGRVELLIGEGHGWPSEHQRVMAATFAFLDQYLKK
ncbi:MAG: alpha/beta hydrolase [Pirellulales bacterium]